MIQSEGRAINYGTHGNKLRGWLLAVDYWLSHAAVFCVRHERERIMDKDMMVIRSRVLCFWRKWRGI